MDWRIDDIKDVLVFGFDVRDGLPVQYAMVLWLVVGIRKTAAVLLIDASCVRPCRRLMSHALSFVSRASRQNSRFLFIPNTTTDTIHDVYYVEFLEAKI